MVENWNYDYNNHRPHNALGNKTPMNILAVTEDKNSNFEWSEKQGGLQPSVIGVFLVCNPQYKDKKNPVNTNKTKEKL